MNWKPKVLTLTLLSAVAFCQSALAQTAPATVLDIEVANFVNYFSDVTDWSRLATDLNRTTLTQPRNFGQSIGMADIVAVNGKAAKGTFTDWRVQLNRQVNPTAGQAIADSPRSSIHHRYFEILKPDGALVGTIMLSGMGGGVPPPGAPSAISDANFMITGGNGAWGQGGKRVARARMTLFLTLGMPR